MDKFQKIDVAAFIVRKDGKFLVTKRSLNDDFMPGLFDVPGGSLEFGEKPEDALKREVGEESGLNVEIIKPIFVFSMIQNEVRHQVWIIYECKYKSGEVKLDSQEHGEYKWVNFDESKNLPKIIFLEEFLKNSENYHCRYPKFG